MIGCKKREIQTIGRLMKKRATKIKQAFFDGFIG
jgi:ribosomal 50S subunit-associated protein YjgA (DUF615 family)